MTQADRRKALRDGRLTYEQIAFVAGGERELRELYDLHAALVRSRREEQGRCRECGAVPCARWTNCPPLE